MWATVQKFVGTTLLAGLFAVGVHAAETNCDICGMKIPDRAKNLMVLMKNEPGAKPLHVCSLGCARKARKHDSTFIRAEIADFNRPESMLAGDKAYFLIQSAKIQSDMGEMAMAPYVAGFKTRKEAETAKAKYGDGLVVEGLENVLK